MEHFSKKQKDRSQKKIETQVEELIIERGSKALEQARNHILREKIESKETREAPAAIEEYGRLLGMIIMLRDGWEDIVDFKEIAHDACIHAFRQVDQLMQEIARNARSCSKNLKKNRFALQLLTEFCASLARDFVF